MVLSSIALERVQGVKLMRSGKARGVRQYGREIEGGERAGWRERKMRRRRCKERYQKRTRLSEGVSQRGGHIPEPTHLECLQVQPFHRETPNKVCHRLKVPIFSPPL